MKLPITGLESVPWDRAQDIDSGSYQLIMTMSHRCNRSTHQPPELPMGEVWKGRSVSTPIRSGRRTASNPENQYHGYNIRIGALGEFLFDPGTYIYTGRAIRNLRSRVNRHLRREKKLRWHIDYLLDHARIEHILVFPDQAASECLINLETARSNDYRFPVPGFGSSDCKCPAHLVGLPAGAIR